MPLRTDIDSLQIHKKLGTKLNSLFQVTSLGAQTYNEANEFKCSFWAELTQFRHYAQLIILKKSP